ncbi:putative DNA repair protein RAD23-1 [Acorus calamus]|uniref:Ubiquitin receptor RAD23 n=1 Tax=Acorus calamus TaxID=4465 RepID=A0AAV9EVX3_ACOCL|nr:putative DNA repair protein RAD23-1 [Acorus calamus]
MNLKVKTLKGSNFQIHVQPTDTIMAVKKNIEETTQGKDKYPCGQQLLIHNGKVLKDESTLEENKIDDDGFIVVMLSKSKTSSTSGSSSAQPLTTSVASHPTPQEAPAATPAPVSIAPSSERQAAETTVSAPTSERLVTENPVSITPAPERQATEISANSYGQAASNLVAGSNLDPMIQQLIDMGGGNWDRDMVVRALRAAYNNPERAVEYLYSGIPASADIPVARIPSNQASDQGTDSTEANIVGDAPPSSLPNSSPLNLFPQGAANVGAGVEGGSLEFLRDNHQFQQLRRLVQANPQILQPMLQELAKHNPRILRLIQENHAEFLQLLNEPLDGEGDMFEPAEQEMPHAINVTPAEQEALDRLEAMGFERALVIEAFLACDRNEELAANYLLEHSGDFDD